MPLFGDVEGFLQKQRIRPLVWRTDAEVVVNLNDQTAYLPGAVSIFSPERGASGTAG